MAQHIVAMDVSATAVRVAIIEASFRRASLLDVRTVKLDPGMTQEQVWERVRMDMPGSLDSVVVGLDPKVTSTRVLTFPFGDLRKAEAAVDFELEGQIPYAMSDVATCHALTTRAPNSIGILAAITPKEQLRGFFRTLSASGLEIRAAVVPTASLNEYLPVTESTPAAVVCIGAAQTHVAVGRNGILRFVRALRAGGDDLDRALAKAFGVSVETARQSKETEGRLVAAGEVVPDDVRKLSDALGDGLASVVRNLVSTFKSIAPEEVPQRIVLTGGTSRLAGLSAFLSTSLGIPCELLDLRGATQSLPGGPVAVGPEYALALAMAVSMFRHGRDIPLNFRRGEFAYHGDIQLYRGQFTRMAVGLAAVFTLAIFASVVRYSMLRGEEKELDKGFCAATQRIVGREICDPVAALATLKQPAGPDGAAIPSYSAGALLEMLSKTIGTDVDVQFDELDLRVEASGGAPERLTGKGEAASFETTEQLVAAVKRDACVQDAEVTKLRKNSGSGRVEFNLAAKVVCPPGIRPGIKIAAAAAPVPAGAAPGSPGPGPGNTPENAQPVPSRGSPPVPVPPPGEPTP